MTLVDILMKKTKLVVTEEENLNLGRNFTTIKQPPGIFGLSKFSTKLQKKFQWNTPLQVYKFISETFSSEDSRIQGCSCGER